jgi:hypothetical protein
MSKRRRLKRKSVEGRPVPDETDRAIAELDDVGRKELELVRQWVDADEQWRANVAAATYDGILGSLPDWFPRGIAVDFDRVRYNLLGSTVDGVKVSPTLAVTWIDRYARIGESGEEYIPFEVFEVIGQLARWRWIVGLGEKKGLRELGVPSQKFLGRKPGALHAETVYLVRLRKKFLHETAAGLYQKLKVLAQNPYDEINPTPDKCPFAWRYEGKGLMLKRGRPYSEGTFRNTLTDIDRRLARGEFPEL